MRRNVEVDSHRRVSRKGRVSKVRRYSYARDNQETMPESPEYNDAYYYDYYNYDDQPNAPERYEEPPREKRSGNNALTTAVAVGGGLLATAGLGIGGGLLWKHLQNAPVAQQAQAQSKAAAQTVVETIFDTGASKTAAAQEIVKDVVDNVTTAAPNVVKLAKDYPNIRSKVIDGQIYRPKVRLISQDIPIRRRLQDARGSRYITLEQEKVPTSSGVVPYDAQKSYRDALATNDLVETKNRELYERIRRRHRTKVSVIERPDGTVTRETTVTSPLERSVNYLQARDIPLRVPAKRALREGLVAQRLVGLNRREWSRNPDVAGYMDSMDEAYYRPLLQRLLGKQHVDSMLRNPITANKTITEQIQEKAREITAKLIKANPQLRSESDQVYRHVLDLSHDTSVGHRLRSLKSDYNLLNPKHRRGQRELQLHGKIMNTGLVHRRGYLLALRKRYKKYTGYDAADFAELNDLNEARQLIKQRTKVLAELIRDPKYGREFIRQGGGRMSSNIVDSDGDMFTPSGRGRYYVGEDNVYTGNNRINQDIATTTPPQGKIVMSKSSRAPNTYEVHSRYKPNMRDKYGRKLLRSEQFGVTTTYSAPTYYQQAAPELAQFARSVQ